MHNQFLIWISKLAQQNFANYSNKFSWYFPQKAEQMLIEGHIVCLCLIFPSDLYKCHQWISDTHPMSNTSEVILGRGNLHLELNREVGLIIGGGSIKEESFEGGRASRNMWSADLVEKIKPISFSLWMLCARHCYKCFTELFLFNLQRPFSQRRNGVLKRLSDSPDCNSTEQMVEWQLNPGGSHSRVWFILWNHTCVWLNWSINLYPL